jgi:hypothetical protein
MKQIYLCGGYVTQVSDEDYDRLNKYQWCISTCGKVSYVVRRQNNGIMISMHREIIGADNIPDGIEIDHADRDGLNNQRENLRLASKSQQQANIPPYSGCSSKFKGVCWFTPKGKWRARINYKKKEMHLGYFDSEDEAGIHYDMAALGLFGVFAYLNFPELKEEYSKQLLQMGFSEGEEGIWRS